VKQTKKYLVSLRTSHVSLRALGPLAGGAEVEAEVVEAPLHEMHDKHAVVSAVAMVEVVIMEADMEVVSTPLLAFVD
jgi:hypothetical protein